MLKELSEYLNGDMSDDYWYDDALFICEDILKEFSDKEWNELLSVIPNETVTWRIRLAECLGDIHSPFELQCIMKMINSENNDLLVACVDSLRDMDISLLKETDKIEIMNQVKSLMEESSPPIKKVFEIFLKKCLLE